MALDPTLVQAIMSAVVGAVLHVHLSGIRKAIRRLGAQQSRTHRQLRSHVRTPSHQAHPPYHTPYPMRDREDYPPPAPRAYPHREESPA